MKKFTLKKALSLLLALVMVVGMLPITASAAEAGVVPVYIFVLKPDTTPDPDDGTYAEFPGYTQGSALSTSLAANIEANGYGIRDVANEETILQYLNINTLPNGSLEAFENFGEKTFRFEQSGSFDSSASYDSDKYDLVWIAASKKEGFFACYCGIRNVHLHIDVALAKKPEKVSEKLSNLTLKKTIPAAQDSDLSFDFQLVKLLQDANGGPTTTVDPNFTSLTLTAMITQGKTVGDINYSGTDEIGFGYYMLAETTSPKWQSNPVYISVGTDGTIWCSESLNPNSFTGKEATIRNEIRNYTVTWLDDDNTLLNTSSVPYGGTPVFPDTQPTKTATAQYTYAFAGWDLVTPDDHSSSSINLANCTVEGDMTFKAIYTPTVRSYTVTWADEDGTVLETDTNVPYGTTPTFDKADPVKSATAQYTYSFDGWDKEVVPVTGNITYVAKYNAAVNKYTVTWKNEDGTVLETDTEVPYGSNPRYNSATPTKAPTAQHSFAFAGWTPGVSAVTDDVTYTARYTEDTNAYDITWVDEDGTELHVIRDLDYGTRIPAYPNTLPEKTDTAQYDYSFAGWELEVGDESSGNVTGHMKYIATYSATVRSYTVTWKNENGTTLEQDTVKYGDVPAYSGATPTKTGDAQYSYSFKDWDHPVVAVTGNVTYTATYNQSTNTYTVTWKNDDGTVLETDINVPYGTSTEFNSSQPVKTANLDERYSYTFTGWDPEVADTVTGDMTYTATYSRTQVRFAGTVQFILNGTYDSTTHTASGTPTDANVLLGTNTALYLSADRVNYYPLAHTGVGTYTHTALPNGTYQLYVKGGTYTNYTLLCNQHLVIDNADRVRYEFYNSVTYLLDDSENAPVFAEEYYHESSAVQVSKQVPAKTDYVFTGWKEGNNTYAASTDDTPVLLTGSISEEHTLTAQWVPEAKVNVTVNIKPGTDHGPRDLHIVLTHRENANDPYVEVNRTSAYKTINIESGQNIQLKYDGIYTGLSGAGSEYGANVMLPGYKMTGKVISPDPGDAYTYNVAVTLEYDPAGFELEYHVVVHESVPDADIPRALDLIITYWDDQTQRWVPIAEHSATQDRPASSVDVSIDGRAGSDNYHVWGFKAVNEPYYYRIQPLNIDLDGTNSIYATTNDTVIYNAFPYTIEVKVEGGGTPVGSNLAGAYAVRSDTDVYTVGSDTGVYTVRSDSVITAIIRATPHTVTFVIDENRTYTTPKLLRMPDISTFVPTGTNNRVFDGWELTGGTLVGANAWLQNDIVLTAKWKDPITVTGTITAAGFYHLDSERHEINDADRIKELTVLLQNIHANGYTQTVAEQKVTIDSYVDDYGKTTYTFENVPNDGDYRIAILVHNFDEKYQNEPASLTGTENYEAYTATAYNAVLNGDNTANINAYLEFHPETFELNYDVDAAQIGADYRPSAVDVLILYDDGTAWAVISQMQESDGNGGEINVGQEILMTGGTGNGSYDVWRHHPNGHLYDFAVHLQNYTFGGTETAFDSSAPFTVVYKAPAGYDEISGTQDAELSITLVPRTYPITYVLNGGSIAGEPNTHTWSYDTTIPDPTHSGYKFLGWEANEPGLYDATGKTIPASTSKAVVLTARWEKIESEDDTTTYTVTYTDGVADEVIFEDKVYSNLALNAATPVFHGTPSRDGYTFAGWDPEVTDTVTGTVTYTAQWTPDSGGEPGIPPAPPVIYGAAQLTKVDANDPSTLLEKATFRLYRIANGSETLIGSYTTDDNGKIVVGGLTPGNYYWRELRAPEGYKMDATKHHFTVTVGQTAQMTVTNTHSSVPDVFTDQHYAYVVGYPDDTIRPGANITRAEVATIFFRLLTDEVRNQYLTSENNFTDVAETHWFNTAVSTMAAMGVINGYPDDTYKPNAPITRAEFAAICARFDQYGNGQDASFADVYGHWAEDEISIAVANGWLMGYEDDTFHPNQRITRAEAILVINRVLQRLPGSADDLLPNMITWPDNTNTKSWYYLAIQEATNSHSYDRNTNGREYWVSLIETPDWTKIGQ